MIRQQSKQSRLREAQIAPSSNYNVVVHGYVEYPACLDQLFSRYAIVRRGGWVAAWMIVDEDDRCRVFSDCFAKNLTRVNEGRVQQTACNGYVALQAMLRIQHGDVELLDREILQSRRECRVDVTRRANGRPVVAGLRHRLAAIERAEKRLADGVFGRSVRSGEPIPDERLQAMPTAELTVEEASAES